MASSPFGTAFQRRRLGRDPHVRVFAAAPPGGAERTTARAAAVTAPAPGSGSAGPAHWAGPCASALLDLDLALHPGVDRAVVGQRASPSSRSP